MEVFEEMKERFTIPWSLAAQTGMHKVIQEHLKTVAGDLEAFSKHAKRSNVNVDDVKLLCRRNHSLLSQI